MRNNYGLGVRILSYILIPLTVATLNTGCARLNRKIENLIKTDKNITETYRMFNDWFFDNSPQIEKDEYYVDLHVHFNPNEDLFKLEQDIETIMKKVDMVGVTGRGVGQDTKNYISDYDQIVDKLSKSDKYEIKNMGNITEVKNKIDLDILYLVKSQEILTKEGFEVNAIGCDKDFNTNLNLETLLTEIKEKGGISIIAHPYTIHNGHTFVPISKEESEILLKLKDLYDAVEEFNAHNVFWMVKSNINSEEFCNRYKEPGISVSDSHQNNFTVGLGGFSVKKSEIDTTDENAFVDSLNNVIINGKIKNYGEYTTPYAFGKDIALDYILDNLNGYFKTIKN